MEDDKEKDVAPPTDLLGKLPKQTPLWAVGIVTILVAGAVSFVVVYTTIQGEVRQLVTAGVESRERKDLKDTDILSSVLGLVTENAAQITALSNALNQTNIEKTRLQEQVRAIEKDLSATLLKLDACIAELSKPTVKFNKPV